MKLLFINNNFVQNTYKAHWLNLALLFDYQQILQLRKQGIGSQDATRKDLGLLEKLR